MPPAPRLGPPRLTHPERAARRRQMAEAVKNGTPVGVVAGEFDVTLASVYEACRAHGVKVGPERVSAYRIIAALITTDQTQAAIGHELGVTPQRVQEVAALCRAAGIPLHHSRS